MKIKFESNLDYQNTAIKSIVDLFKGQTRKQRHFSVTDYYENPGLYDSPNGIGNKLELDNEDIFENLQSIQLSNGIEQSTSLKSLDFDVEMETGTGKTYVYLKSMMQLHQKYGFCKFIIVVPSVAIREGVYKSLEMTKEHFANTYDNTIYDYFVYDSKKLEQVRSFATADHISIMVINIDAFKKSFIDPTQENKSNIIHRENDKLNGMKPIELIQETYPFVFIDEPQSVDNTPKAHEAIQSLNPVSCFRFSATHIKHHHLIYKLDAVDAFNLGLVKQIEVASFENQNNHNNAYLLLKSVNNKKSPITARIEMDVATRNGIKRKVVTVRRGDDLWEKSGNREVYEGYTVEEIYCELDNEFVSFTARPEKLLIGKSVGEVDDTLFKEAQIKATITAHLDKCLSLTGKAVKVLSLFFIDRVANYRTYDEEGNAVKGKYALLFEESFKSIARHKKYENLFKGQDIEELALQIHNGYFATDKKGKSKDTTGKTAADEDAYALIMKEKERLLSFDTKLAFIFSHSALREGWDNPNVFQICTLNETQSVIKKRQEIGRGLRLCVNQLGQRNKSKESNILTVIANESYDDFCKKLQHEYETDQGIKFGVITQHLFSNILISNSETDEQKPLGNKLSKHIYESFVARGYIDTKGKVKDKFQEDLKSHSLELPVEVELVRPAIEAKCMKAIAGVPIKKISERKSVKLAKERFLSPDFKELWDNIKYKTTYKVEFSSESLVNACIAALQNIRVSKSVLIQSNVKVNVGDGGVFAEKKAEYAVDHSLYEQDLPDIISVIQNKTNLTRKSIITILVNSHTIDKFSANPQQYMDEACKIIRSVMRTFIVDGIKYTRIGDDSYYAQELFNEQELFGYLDKNIVESKKGIYDHVIYDSNVESEFAKKLDTNPSVDVYVKLPSWFKINTPLGSYNPDWAVMVKNEEDDLKKLYFVVETKSTLVLEELRPTEKAKIKCGEAHFAAINDSLGTNICYQVETNESDFMNKI